MAKVNYKYIVIFVTMIVLSMITSYFLTNREINNKIINSLDPLNYTTYDEFKEKYNVKITSVPIYVFYHICTVNMKIVDEQIGELVNSGLYSIATKLFYGCNCSGCDTILEEYMKQYDKFSPIPPAILPDVKTYENGTVNAMINYAKEANEKFYALYIHTKGTSDLSQAQQEWRRVMMYWLVMNHRLCIDILNRDFYTVGLFHTTGLGIHPLHYSGNFYWADSEYLKTLDIIKDMSNRCYAENAILSKHNKNKHINLLKERYLAYNTDQGLYSFTTKIKPTNNPYLAIF